MSIIKKEIQHRGQTAYINLNLDNTNNFLGYQQNIDTLTQVQSLSAVNEVIDGEKRKFPYFNSGSTTLSFFFASFDEYSNDFRSAGFSTDDIAQRSDSILNSFFIADFYDTNIVAKQTKLFTNYLTKIINQSQFPNYIFPVVKDDSINQLYYMYISRSYITQQTTPIITGYTKFSFFSANNGQIITFRRAGESVENELFLPTELNFTGRTWRFIQNTQVVKLYELHGAEYDTRISDTIDKEAIIKPNYPVNEIFNYRTGKYC